MPHSCHTIQYNAGQYPTLYRPGPRRAIHTWIRPSVRPSVHPCTHTCTHACMHAHMRECIRAYVHAYMHTPAGICIHSFVLCHFVAIVDTSWMWIRSRTMKGFYSANILNPYLTVGTLNSFRVEKCLAEIGTFSARTLI